MIKINNYYHECINIIDEHIMNILMINNIIDEHIMNILMINNIFAYITLVATPFFHDH